MVAAAHPATPQRIAMQAIRKHDRGWPAVVALELGDRVGGLEPVAEIAGLLAARQGHFVFESGHHCASWIDLERLFLRPEAVRPFAVELAERLRRHSIEAVCGPLVEGAYVALMVAEHLGVPFTYAERFDDGNRDTLFSVRYRIPGRSRRSCAIGGSPL